MKNNIRIKDQKGATVVEFAIVLPLLVLFVAGTIEFGLLLYNKQVIVNASREGARAGIIAYNSDPPPGEPAGGRYFSDNNAIITIIENYCAHHLITFGDAHELDSDDIDFTPIDRTASSFETPFTVTVTYEYSFLLPGVLGFGPNMELTGTTTMLMQHFFE